jgi:hypothetical protein
MDYIFLIERNGNSEAQAMHVESRLLGKTLRNSDFKRFFPNALLHGRNKLYKNGFNLVNSTGLSYNEVKRKK